MRSACLFWAALAVAALATTASAAPCQKPRQLKLAWDEASGLGNLVFVTYGCALPSTCPTKDGVPATRLPLKVSVRSGTSTLFATELRPCANEAKCKSINSRGCTGGADAHKAVEGMVKFTYQRRGTAAVAARLRGPMKRPPETTGPVIASVTDGAGYNAEVEFEKCRFTVRAIGVTMICL